MSQADQQVQNAAFPAVRTDINDNLAALFSQSSGASAPAVTVAFQPWIDTSSSPAIWKVRNAANTGWITIGTIDATTFNTGGITAIANGGTGQTTATAALAALLPSQAGNSGKALVTDGSLAAWGAIASSQVYTFTASGTWTKPSQGLFAMVSIWGGGGSGGRFSYAHGGGGGACVQRVFLLSDLPSSVTITIGSGGAGRTTSTSGLPGGSSTFGTFFTADGGGGGGVTTGAGGAGGSTSPVYSSLFVGGTAEASSTFGGGGGGDYANLTGHGANSAWGGAGGGAYSNSPQFIGQGGKSLYGGNGGVGNGGVGQIPGGGGGASTSITSGAGGNGLCLIYVW